MSVRDRWTGMLFGIALAGIITLLLLLNGGELGLALILVMGVLGTLSGVLFTIRLRSLNRTHSPEQLETAVKAARPFMLIGGAAAVGGIFLRDASAMKPVLIFVALVCGLIAFIRLRRNI